jgi:hypothetical protein
LALKTESPQGASTGFSQLEIDLVIQEVQEASAKADESADYHPEPGPEPVTRQGDFWALGRHLLACGGNVRIARNVCGLGRVQHREFPEASGEMSREQYTDFLAEAFAVAEKSCRDGAIAFTCMDWRHLGEVIAAGQGVFAILANRSPKWSMCRNWQGRCREIEWVTSLSLPSSTTLMSKQIARRPAIR